MKSQVARKGPLLLIFLGSAVAFIGLGIFLDEAVTPTLASTGKIMRGTYSQVASYELKSTPVRSHKSRNSLSKTFGQAEGGVIYRNGDEYF